MNAQNVPVCPRFLSRTKTRLTILIALAGLIIIPVFSSSLASSIGGISKSLLQKQSLNTEVAQPVEGTRLLRGPFGVFRNLNLRSSSLVETIDTFASDCTSPKTTFFPGETVCAVTDGVDLMGDRHVNWLDPNLTVAGGGDGVADITSNSQSFTFVIPNSVSSIGAWKATIATPTDTSETPAIFSVVAAPPLATYASPGCTVPKASFALGETVCLKVSGAPLGSPGRPARRVAWVARRGSAVHAADVTTDPETFSFVLPNTATTDFVDVGGGTVTVDNRGTWRILLLAAADGTVRDAISFTVNDATPFVDLSVSQSVDFQSAQVDSGSSSAFDIYVTNNGPSTAANVVLSETVPANTNFVALTETSSFGSMCNTPVSGVATCTIAALPAGATAKFSFAYMVQSGVPEGTLITNDVSVASTTTELSNDDNSSTATSIVPKAAGAETCTLGCRENITVEANTTQGGNPGRFVSFTPVNSNAGSCGAITASPASGSFFPLGTTVVNVNSATGSGSCSFTVTVTNTAAPTIACPADKTVDAAPSATSASVNPGTPTTVPSSGVTVVGLRSDDDDDPDTPPMSLTAVPYPIGLTNIFWTVTDASGRSASCQQRIIVREAARDVLTITCPADQTVAAPSGSCEASVTVGTPTTHPSDSNVTVSGVRNDGAALGDPYAAGVTLITWTAIDGVNGNVATCTQTITVSGTDTVAPTLNVPANISTSTSSCSILLDDEIGVATADDNCSPSVNISRTGVPANFNFPTGTTVITYTATDASGNTATGTQTVTVTEAPAIPPTVAAPADVTLYTGAGATSCGVTVANLDTTLGTASANDNCPGVTVARSGVPLGNVFPLGNTVVTYTATDKSGNIASDTQTVTVVDNTIPTITAPADVTLYTGAGATSCGVTVANLDTTLGTATTGDNCPGTVTVARGGVPAGNVFPLGDTFVTYTATDAHSNSSAPVTQKVTVVDNTPPTISCPANVTVYLPLNSTATSTNVTYAAATATDNCPGSIGIGYSQNSGTVFPVGPTTVTATATDAHGNTSSCSFTVTVLYNFTGFFSPVSNVPTVNNVNAGRSIPVKFSLSGNKGLGIMAAGYPASQQITCNSSAPLSDLEGTETPGGSTLTYSPDNYHYNWKTESSWAGTCRQLVVKLNDGSEHIALFKFK